MYVIGLVKISIYIVHVDRYGLQVCIYEHMHAFVRCFVYSPWFSLGIYRVSQEECTRLREGVPYVKVYRYNPKHLCPKLNGYGDNGQRSLKL